MAIELIGSEPLQLVIQSAHAFFPPFNIQTVTEIAQPQLGRLAMGGEKDIIQGVVAEAQIRADRVDIQLIIGIAYLDITRQPLYPQRQLAPGTQVVAQLGAEAPGGIIHLQSGQGTKQLILGICGIEEKAAATFVVFSTQLPEQVVVGIQRSIKFGGQLFVAAEGGLHQPLATQHVDIGTAKLGTDFVIGLTGEVIFQRKLQIDKARSPALFAGFYRQHLFVVPLFDAIADPLKGIQCV